MDSKVDFIHICDNNNHHKIIDFNDVDDLLEKLTEVTKFVIILKDNSNILDFRNELVGRYPNLSFIVMQDSFGTRQWFDVIASGVDKYKAAKYVSELEGISNGNIIAFGDGLNDLEMIENSGVGVAVSNALLEVKEKARYVTLSNIEDGVIEFLIKYLN